MICLRHEELTDAITLRPGDAIVTLDYVALVVGVTRDDHSVTVTWYDLLSGIDTQSYSHRWKLYGIVCGKHERL